MLNTDQHNPQVKHKMTLEQFIRNNRGTNGGADYPRETLEAIFHEIRGNEIKIAVELVAVGACFESARWGFMSRDS
jgi:Sec7-like guanine-nucleotide exchange factor